VTLPKLKPLHSELISLKLESFGALDTDVLIESLQPGKTGSLKTRPDGTIIDGHHRISVLSDRGIDVDLLPREIMVRTEE
jgi:hypothetical protein